MTAQIISDSDSSTPSQEYEELQLLQKQEQVLIQKENNYQTISQNIPKKTQKPSQEYQLQKILGRRLQQKDQFISDTDSEFSQISNSFEESKLKYQELQSKKECLIKKSKTVLDNYQSQSQNSSDSSLWKYEGKTKIENEIYDYLDSLNIYQVQPKDKFNLDIQKRKKGKILEKCASFSKPSSLLMKRSCLNKSLNRNLNLNFQLYPNPITVKTVNQFRINQK